MNRRRTDADGRQFVDIAALYDLLMADVPYKDWLAYLEKLLAGRNARPRHILDLACGTGNVSELLAIAGYSVTGVDIAADMIAQAQRKAAERGLPINYLVQDAADLDVPGRRFDLCVSLFDSLNYVTDPERLACAFDRVRAHLSRNGLFIFDLNTEFALQNHFFDQDNLQSGEPLLYDWRSEYDAATRLCCVNMMFKHRDREGRERAFEEVHWQYAYRTDEILEMLANAGFDEIATFQAYTLRAPTATADRIYYIARSPAPISFRGEDDAA